MESQRVGRDWVTEMNWTELRDQNRDQNVKKILAHPKFLYNNAVSIWTTWIWTPKICIYFSFFNEYIQVSSVESLSHVQFFETPWTAACQASQSITNSRSLHKLMLIESVMPCNHLILCHPLLLPPSIFPRHHSLFKWVSSLHQVAKVLEFQLQHQSF